MKQIIQKLWMVVAMLSMFIPVSAYDFEVDGIYYTITSMSNLEVEVTYSTLELSQERAGSSYYDCFKNATYTGDIIIPSYVNYNNKTFSVTTIGECAFGGKVINSYGDVIALYSANLGCNITSISLPNSIKTIKNSAFSGCRNLSSVKLGDEITEIMDYTFHNAESLQSLELPNSLKKIGRHSLSGTGLYHLAIPNSVEELADYACSRNLNLNSLIIGKSVSHVGDDVFYKNSKLLEVFCLPTDKPIGIGIDTFSGCHAALEIYVPSTEKYGLGREYLTFPTASVTYTGQSHNIEWSNNLKAYKCEIAESECLTEVNAGEYTKYLTATYSDGIDLSVEIPYSYTINKAPMTLTVNKAERKYGEPNPEFSSTITGFVNGESIETLGITPTYECSATQRSAVGDYRILASLNTPNYDITYTYGELSVLPAPLTISIEDQTKVYGDANPSFSMKIDGLMNGETYPQWTITPTFLCEATKNSSVGEYPITISDGTAKNYDVSNVVDGLLSITKRALTAKALDEQRKYGEDNPKLALEYSGFINGDTVSDLEEEPIATCEATAESNVGSYPIVPTGGEAKNYDFNYVEGVLTVKPLTFGFENESTIVTYGDMTQSCSDTEFRYMPIVTSDYSKDDYEIKVWALDNKEKTSGNDVIVIENGAYKGRYIPYDGESIAGKYLYQLIKTSSNDNFEANPSRSFVTVESAPSTLKWNSADIIHLIVGVPVELDIDYPTDSQWSYNFVYNEGIVKVYSEEDQESGKLTWWIVGLTSGNSDLSFQLLCKENEFGFYNYENSSVLSRRIEVEYDPTQIACVTYSLGEIGKLSTFVKVGETVSLDTKGTEDWEVSEVLINEAPFDFEGDVLSVQITEDTDIHFVYQYAHEISYDFTTGTTTPSDSPYNISNDGEKILIRGLNGHEAISIYTVNGMLMINIPDIPEDMDMVAFTLDPGVYIILINDISFKIKH